MTDDFLPELPAGAFDKQDAGDDLAFYAPPRLVTHIDAGAVAALTGLYSATLPAGGRILDVMSSWISHLPNDRDYAEIVGHGMNADELAANPRLSRWFVQDLNSDPTLPLDAGAFDAALCCVGVQYLQRPIAVFAEVRRVLVAGAPFVVSFSNRCFPTKAMALPCQSGAGRRRRSWSSSVRAARPRAAGRRVGLFHSDAPYSSKPRSRR